MSDFQIHPELIDMGSDAAEKLREMEERFVRDYMDEEERAIVRSIWKGHDFMDVYHDIDGVHYLAYDEGHAPERPANPYNLPFTTYDLRGVTFQDIREYHKNE